ncbi:MAG: hypothetical protein QOI36_3535, partial [Pseudonocardiales bacterium]|nr:hypothetical protein [Pseudonocardiales bacterium]
LIEADTDPRAVARDVVNRSLRAGGP